jgi:hypothetical protein
MHVRAVLTALPLLALVYLGQAFAQDGLQLDEQYFEHGIQMAQVDRDAPHAALIEACAAAFPATIPELTDAIAAWRAANRATQIELQKLILTKYPDPAGAGAMRKQFLALTESATRAYGHLPPQDLKQFCNGGYAQVTLRLREMDFPSLLRNLRAKGVFK